VFRGEREIRVEDVPAPAMDQRRCIEAIAVRA
jgi:hypothetical protein